MGAAAEAAGISGYFSACVYFSIMAHTGVACPVCAAKSSVINAGVINTVMHLNDRHMWSRERIAEWVATIENAEEQTPEPVEVIQEECLETIGSY